jgi:hypothetical protein
MRQTLHVLDPIRPLRAHLKLHPIVCAILKGEEHGLFIRQPRDNHGRLVRKKRRPLDGRENLRHRGLRQARKFLREFAALLPLVREVTETGHETKGRLVIRQDHSVSIKKNAAQGRQGSDLVSVSLCQPPIRLSLHQLHLPCPS